LRTVRLRIAFQGTRYDGWQSQRTGKTLQELFEKHLARIFKTKTVLHSSSRTDAGVHARGLVAHFCAKAGLGDDKIKDALNFYLPGDVLVLEAKTVPAKFHARFSAKAKTYEYLIWNDRTRPAYDLAPYCLWVPAKLDTAKMRRAAHILTGKRDFSAFQDSGEDDRNPVKTLRSALIQKRGPRLSIRVTGDGFLRHMVRILAGTLIDVGRGKLLIKDIESIIASKNRRKSGPTARAHGLTLLEVHY
jgi:tRNA pseudouridine38-40 synthase